MELNKENYFKLKEFEKSLYEKERQEKINSNIKLLDKLGLSFPEFYDLCELISDGQKDHTHTHLFNY